MLSIIIAGSLAGCASQSASSRLNTATAGTTTVAVAFQRGLTVRWVRHPEKPKRIAVEIEGINPEALRSMANSPPDQTQWSRLLAVYVAPPDEPQGRASRSARGEGKSDGSDVPPVLGRYEILPDRIRFEPQFPVQPGLSYRVELRLDRLRSPPSSEADPIVAWFRLPAAAKIPKTVVQHIYPSSNRLPENLLKFYVQFSGPMSRGRVYEHIQLLDATGKPVELPFLEIDEELWNPELTRLTLFIDPGRIKRGVQPLEEIGPAIEAGRRYTLVIDRDWLDADGASLKTSCKKVFTVGPPDREPPDIKTWIVKPPRTNTDEPLIIRFPEPMDQALVQRMIRVVDLESREVEGRITLSDQERRWSFAPVPSWKPGRYRIVASGVTEDLAGNSIGRPFEVDLFDTVQKQPSEETFALSFEVRSR